MGGWVNFGGIKNSHDGMCVPTSDDVGNPKSWGFYSGPKDTKDPEEAYPPWNHDDGSLAVKCVPKTVHIDSRKVPVVTRGPMLRKLYRRTGRLIREKCGPHLVPGKLNMDAWTELLKDKLCPGSKFIKIHLFLQIYATSHC